MKKNLLKAAVVAIGVMMCGSAWADTTQTFNPTAEYNVRPKTDGTGWTTSPTAGAASTKKEFELKAQAAFYAIQQFKVTDLAAVKSMTLTLTNGSGSDALAIWAFKGTFSEDMTASDFNTAFEATTGVKPGKGGTSTATYLLVNTTSTKSPTRFTITDLTELKKLASADGTITLLITNKTEDIDSNSDTQRKYLSSNSENAESNRPTLTVTYAPVYNVTTSAQYTGLKAAVDAASANNEIKVMEDQSLSARVDIAKAVTIDGNSKTITINQTGYSGFLITEAATVKNATITGANGEKAVFEIGGDKAAAAFEANIENVTVNNANVGSNGVYRVVKNATANLKDVTNSGATVATGYGEIFVGSNATICNISGTCTVNSVYVEKDKRVNLNGATISNELVLNCASAYQSGYVALQNVNSTITVTTATSGWQAYKSKTISDAKYEYSLAKVINTYDLTVSDAGAATLVLPYNATIPDNVNVYTLNYNTDATSAKATPVTGTLDANTPVYVIANAGTYTFAAVSDAGCTYTEDPTFGALIGSYANSKTLTYAGTTPYFVLSKEDSGVGFYMAKSTKVNQYHAYMKADNAATAKGGFIGISFDDATAISNVNANTSTSSAQAQGKFIQDGKLVIVKNGKQYNAAGAQVK